MKKQGLVVLLAALLLWGGEASAQGPYSAQIQAALRNYPWSYPSDPVTCDSVVAHTIYYNTASNVLKYCNGTSWLTISDTSMVTTIVSGTTPITGGADTQICFNDGGFMSCGDSGLTYTKATDSLTVNGPIQLSNGGVIYGGGGTSSSLTLGQAGGTYLRYSSSTVIAMNGSSMDLAAGGQSARVLIDVNGVQIRASDGAAALFGNNGDASGIRLASALPFEIRTSAAYPLILGTNGADRDYLYDGTKTLTAGAATNVVRVAVAQGTVTGGLFKYCVRASDATDFLARCGDIPWTAVNKGGTETCTMGTPRDICSDTVTPGTCLISTLTAAFTCASNAADTVDIQINAAAAITETTLNAGWRLTRDYGAAAAITPQ